jgi:hypothetical protein
MLGRYLDLGTPVARDHPLNRDLAASWLGLPTRAGGSRILDVVGTAHATRSSDVTWVPGPGEFAGLNVPVTGNGQPASFVLSSPAFTVSAWARAASLGAGGFGSVLFGVFKDNALGEYAFVNFSGTSAALWASITGGDAHSPSAFGSSTSGPWVHYAWVRTGNSGNHFLYVNGVRVGDLSSGAAWFASGGTPYLHVGGRPDTANCAWGGPYADVEVRNRALSATEVAALYDQARRGYPDTLRRWSRRAYLFAQVALDPRTGDLAVTQAGNTLAAAGTVAVAASAGVTQGDQAGAAAGAVAVAGAAAITQAGDSVASAGAVAVAGAGSPTQDGQTVASAGATEIAGAVTLTQADHTLAGAGAVTATGAAALAADGDTLASAGTTAIGGSGVMTQDGQTSAAAGTVTVVGASAVTPAEDALAAAGATLVGGAGVLAQAGQELAAAGVVAVAGSAAITQASHTLAAAGFAGGPPAPRVSPGTWARADRAGEWGRAAGSGDWAPAVYTGTWGV